MTYEEIKQAVNEGKNVYWRNKCYKVMKSIGNEYFIVFGANLNMIGLYTEKYGLNGKEDEFFIA